MVRKNLWLRPVRSWLTIAGLAIAVGAIVSLVGIAQRFEQAFLELYNRRGGDLVVQRAGGAMQLASGIDQRVGQRIRSLPHVQQVIGSLMDMVAFEQSDLFAVIVNGWEPDSPVLSAVDTVSGRRLRAGDRQRVMLGNVLAANLGKHVGDRIELYGEPFEVVGIFESFSILESGAVFVLLDELQRLMHRPNHVTGYLVEVDKTGGQNTVEQVQRQIEAFGPQISVLPTGSFIKSIAQIKVVRAMADVTSLVAIVIGALSVANTMTMSVLERRAEIGMLHAVGWRPSRVLTLILLESLLLCVVGAVAGCLLGLVTIKAMAHISALSGLVDGRLSASILLDGCLLALAAGMLGALYPAWWAMRLTPLAALRAKT
ncbi:MAG TPA: ABC transporter permease [Pirellulales bacterium]|jgi:putative ABC transport system permease protein|nr:ABC transporter permease [Pirellulales bacterium]